MAASDPAPANTRLRKNAVGVIGILFFVLSAQAPLTGIAGATPLSVGIGNGAGAPGAYLLVRIVAGAVEGSLTGSQVASFILFLMVFTGLAVIGAYLAFRHRLRA